MEKVFSEKVLYNRYGKAVFRVRGTVIYDYLGKPRGFVVGKTVYDILGQHRGFLVDKVLLDRGGRVIGYEVGAVVNGLNLPPVEVPPVAYKDLPPPEPPENAVDLECPNRIPLWSIMQLENFLPAYQQGKK
ncbi:MAG: 4-fold beta flower protein [candidate division WOR-3 bacterium]